MQELKDNFLKGFDPFFAKLDQESKTLRNAAKEFADFLLSGDIQLPAKQLLIDSLKEIQAADIEKIDIAIDDVKKNMLLVTAQIKAEQKSDVDKEQAEKLAKQTEAFLDKNYALLEAADSFIKRALILHDELNK